jgi:hypothetical protein
VALTVSRKERNRAPFDLADGDRTRRGAVRRIDLDLFDIVEERVETGASKDPYLCATGHAGFSPLVLVDSFLPPLLVGSEEGFVSEVLVSEPEEAELDEEEVFFFLASVE